MSASKKHCVVVGLLVHLVLAGLAGCGESANRLATQSSLLAEEALDSVTGNPFDLIQERYPDTMSLPNFIRQLRETSQTVKVLDQIFFILENKLGVQIKNRASKINIIDHPEKLLDILQFTAEQMDSARKVITKLSKRRIPLPYEGKLLPPLLRLTYQLPATFDYLNLDRVPIELLPTTFPAGDKVFVGFLRNPAEDEAQIRRNVIFSEIVERLSTNLTQDSKHRFRVVYNGATFERLDEFIAALVANGHQITAVLRHYVAPFIPIYTKAEDGRIIPVSVTIFMKTGFHDQNQKEAILPTIHSELLFSIKPGDKTVGQAIDAEIQYYQGIPKMGFYGYRNMNLDAWLGLKISDTFSSEEAHRALILGGYMVQLNRSLVKREHLVLDGWAVDGVCNDSAAVLQMAIKGHVNSYPLAMVDTEYLNEIKQRLADNKHPALPTDVEIYQTLKHAIELTPEDIKPEPTALRRLMTAIPWEVGKEPFPSIIKARHILDELQAE